MVWRQCVTPGWMTTSIRTNAGRHPEVTDTRKRLGLSRAPLFCTLQGKPVSDTYVRAMMKWLGRKGADSYWQPPGTATWPLTVSNGHNA